MLPVLISFIFSPCINRTRNANNHQLRLYGDIVLSVPGSATWSVDDTNLNLAAVTGMRTSGSLGVGAYSFGLTIPPGRLSEHGHYHGSL